MLNKGPGTALGRLYRKQQEDTLLADYRGDMVMSPGHGADHPRVVFIGHLTKGHSEAFLRKTMDQVGIHTEHAYFTDGFKHTHNGRVPYPEEFAGALWYIEREVNLLRPTVVVPMGQRSYEMFTDVDCISNVHGAVFDWKRFWLIPILHPCLCWQKEVFQVLYDDLSVVHRYMYGHHKHRMTRHRDC